jgi:hypothetical protein
MVDHKLMKDLESRTFRGFAELARYLREEIVHMNREQLGRALGYPPRAASARIQQIETGAQLAGVVSLTNYLKFFVEMDPMYAARLVGADRTRQLYHGVLERIGRRYSHRGT